jgi:hypothetical protein
MHRPQAVLCDVALLLFLLFAAKLSASDILFSAEILGRRRFLERRTARELAVLSQFSAVCNP